MGTSVEDSVSAQRVPPRCPVCGKIMEIRTYSNRPQLEYYAFCTGCMTEMQFPDSAQWMQIHILNAIRYELKRIGDILEEK